MIVKTRKRKHRKKRDGASDFDLREMNGDRVSIVVSLMVSTIKRRKEKKDIAVITETDEI